MAYEGTHLDQMIHLAECHAGKKVVTDQNSVPIGFASHQKNPVCKAFLRFLSVFLCLLLLFSHSAEESLLGFVHQHELGETALNLREGGSFGYSSYRAQSPTPKHTRCPETSLPSLLLRKSAFENPWQTNISEI